MLLYKNGDAAAFEELYHRHKGGLYRYTLRSCNNKTIGEELFQDIWAKVIHASGSYSDTAKFSTWVYHIAHNRLIDHYRSTGKWDDYLVENDVDNEHCAVVAHHDQPEQQSETNQKVKLLLACIELLPASQKQVFLLKEEAGLSLGAITEMIKCSKEAIKSRMRYAIQKLRNCMGGEI
ncbi:MAG: sigma-70 family RNA polymerase sigma factor [Ghiorsea sp.]